MIQGRNDKIKDTTTGNDRALFTHVDAGSRSRGTHEHPR